MSKVARDVVERRHGAELRKPGDQCNDEQSRQKGLPRTT
jgi:hypothetical protein